ncbi:mitochondrial import inner membrane translocase subunit Tim21 [Teleopsis dalmanni]|uniref:mitochondrial import inner membrane translocase subunit Tim21 n=1 Tax=Teleopsis dalmanni TaxID=139649 RepID=UPI0018CD714D|nr:mitochondrial import inner membrane translocase subunit Tim21 [Teleopsis dalmanni]XP_037927689.1 mitochondrial import inner membrane translocase subunit Tim21 [Teleopsis dalmanni]
MSQLKVLSRFFLSKSRFATQFWLQQQQKIQFSYGRQMLQQRRKQESSEITNVQKSNAGAGSSVSNDVRPLGEKIKENTKTMSYTAIIVAGIGVTAIMFYAICRELFSSDSANNIYSDALNKAIEDPRVQDALGAPIKGFGEKSRRGRRQHVAHTTYERNGKPHMRMKFYIQGIRNKATVHLESRLGTFGKIEYRYIFVQLDYYPHTTIILEDNRAFDSQAAQTQPALNYSEMELASYDKK